MTLTNGGSNGNLSWKNSQLHWYVSTSNPLVKKLRLLLDKCSCIKLPKATVHLERPWRKGTSETGQLEYLLQNNSCTLSILLHISLMACILKMILYSKKSQQWRWIMTYVICERCFYQILSPIFPLSCYVIMSNILLMER